MPPDILTFPSEGVPSFATGRHTFMVLHEYDQKVINDPKASKIAGAVKNALMPGKTQSTFVVDGGLPHGRATRWTWSASGT